MKEKNDFALVPRSPNAIEKAEPGTKRVLSSMVADTLALAKPTALRVRQIVILDDEPFMTDLYLHVLHKAFSGLEILNFTEGDAAWREISRADPDLLITDVFHLGMRGDDMLAELANRKVKYPIFVVSGTLDLIAKDVRSSWASNLNATIISKPFKSDVFLESVKAALQLRARPAL